MEVAAATVKTLTLYDPLNVAIAKGTSQRFNVVGEDWLMAPYKMSPPVQTGPCRCGQFLGVGGSTELDSFMAMRFGQKTKVGAEYLGVLVITNLTRKSPAPTALTRVKIPRRWPGEPTQRTAAATFTDGSTQNPVSALTTWTQPMYRGQCCVGVGYNWAGQMQVGTASTLLQLRWWVFGAAALTVRPAALVSVVLNPVAPPSPGTGRPSRLTASYTVAQQMYPGGLVGSPVPDVM